MHRGFCTRVLHITYSTCSNDVVLSICCADAFRDGRVLVAITQFDNTYQVPLGETRVTEDKACTTMHKIIQDVTGQAISKTDVVPISGRWALSSKMLSGIIEYPFMKEFEERKQQVITLINNYPEVMHNLTCGQDEHLSIHNMEPFNIAKILEDASRIAELTKRYDSCLSISYYTQGS